VGRQDCSLTSPLITEFPILYSFSLSPGLEQTVKAAASHVARPSDLALIVHTPGATGTPKAVPLSHANILSNLSALAAAGVAGPSERAFMPLPLHHIYPLVVGLFLPLSTGGSVVLPGGFSGPEFAHALRSGGATALIGVPRLYESFLAMIKGWIDARGGVNAWTFHRFLGLSVALARRGQRSFGQLAFKAIRRSAAPRLYRLVSGGAKLEEETELKLLGLGYDLVTGYGLSETAPVVTFNRPDRSRIGSAGEPLPGVGVRISESKIDSLGEIEVRGPNVFAGYLNDPDSTRTAFTADGWFRSGDLGWIGADGGLYVAGRQNEAIVLPAGKKIVPETLEAHYAANPAIEEIGILVETGKLVGFVVPSQSAQAAGTPESAEAAVHDALSASAALLPGYMQLSGFALSRLPLPRSETGKLQRHLLPALYRNAKISAKHHAASQAVTEADRMLLADHAARRVWTWLEARFAGQRLSLDMNPTLDLGLDSLDWMTITMELEQALGIVLDQPTASLRDLVVIASRARQQLTPAEAVLPPEPGIFSRAGWYAVNAINRLLLRTLFRLKVRGLEYLPDHAPYLICPNHLSYLDPPALAAALPWPVLRQTYWAGSADIMFSSGWRRALSRRGRVLAVDPALGVRGGLALSEAALRRGNILVWFPEGWRSWDGTLMPFLPGIGVLLQKTPVPVVPVSIQGTFEAWPRQHRFPYPHPVSVRFGHPLDPKQWAGLPATKDAEVQIALEVRESVAALGKG
jgi:long-chain acyl-CoA synthetase